VLVSKPQAVNAARLAHTNDPHYRQDAVQASRDNGKSWDDILADPADVRFGDDIPIDLPPAPLLRMVAAADNATTPEKPGRRSGWNF
jgi:hypothetical protein